MLDRDDVDTDQIIPKQFLKRVERTGFGEFLFYDWRKEPGWSCRPNPILVAGRNFGCGSSREHAPVGARGLRLPGGRRAELRGHLLLQLHEDRAAAGRAPEADVRALMAGGRGARSTSRRRTVRFDGREVPFEIDPEIKHRLLNGLDDIAHDARSSEDAIDRYERERERVRARSRRRCEADSATRDWDAADLRPRLGPRRSRWAGDVLERLDLRGDETVLDAGCGAGRVTGCCSSAAGRAA